jgi:hypothetical protein
MRFISSPSDSEKDRAATPAPTCRLKPAIATRVALPQPRPQAVAGLAERAGGPTDPLVPTTTGTHLSRDAIERRLARHLTTAAQTCPSLKTKHITMHTLRHYVDGWVMWPAGVFPAAGGVVWVGSGHIIRVVIGRSGRAIRGDLGRLSSWAGARG